MGHPNADAIMDSGCTHPLITLTVTDALKMKITPLARDLEIVEASGKNLTILGSSGHRGRGASEVLVSLGLLKKWDMIHDSFSGRDSFRFYSKSDQYKQISLFFALQL